MQTCNEQEEIYQGIQSAGMKNPSDFKDLETTLHYLHIREIIKILIEAITLVSCHSASIVLILHSF